MKLRHQLRSALRRTLMPIFSRLNPGNIHIRHHWTGDPVYLHSFRHRSYWFQGRKRELSTMQLFENLVREGDTVLDVGGHIGYTALHFAHLVGPQGKVFVFEPSPENLRYLHRNVSGKPAVFIIPAGAAASESTAVLFMEQLSGQNSTFVENFDTFHVNLKSSACTQFKPVPIEVPITTIDHIVSMHRLAPQFVKIDVEGYERDALVGMRLLLKDQQPMLMVEVQRYHTEVFRLLSEAGYLMCRPHPFRILLSPNDLEMNTFCFHRVKHQSQISELEHFKHGA